MRRQKRRYQDAEGVEEGWEWGGVSLSQPTKGVWNSVASSSAGSGGGSPAANVCSALSQCHRTLQAKRKFGLM